jgi:translation initiation factor IF-3
MTKEKEEKKERKNNKKTIQYNTSEVKFSAYIHKSHFFLTRIRNLARALITETLFEVISSLNLVAFGLI